MIKIIESIEDIKTLVEHFSDKEAYFRGQSNEDWELDASFSRVNHFNDVELQNQWESYKKKYKKPYELFLKQHTGKGKTLLIDFTKNFLVALFFSTSDSSKKNGIIYILTKKNTNLKIININKQTEWSNLKLDENGIIYDFSKCNGEDFKKPKKQESVFIIKKKLNFINEYKIEKIKISREFISKESTEINEYLKINNLHCEELLLDKEACSYKNEENEDIAKLKEKKYEEEISLDAFKNEEKLKTDNTLISRDDKIRNKTKNNETLKIPIIKNECDFYPWNTSDDNNGCYYTKLEVFNFLMENIFCNNFRYYSTHAFEVHLIELDILRSIYKMKGKKICWDDLINKIKYLWQNNILIQKINNEIILKKENFPPYVVKNIFNDFSIFFNESEFIKKINSKNKNVYKIKYNDFFEIWEKTLGWKNKWISEEINNERSIDGISNFKIIRSPYNNEYSENVLKKNIESLENFFSYSYEKSLLKNKNKDIDSLYNFIKKKFFIFQNHEINDVIIDDLTKLSFDFWIYFNEYEKKSLKEVLENNKKINISLLYEEKINNILVIYFYIKNYFEQDLSKKPLTSISFGNGIRLYKDKKYILYLKKINYYRTNFLERIIIPLSNSLRIFYEDNKENNYKLIGDHIFNHLKVIQRNLDFSLFFIPTTFRYKEEFYESLFKMFINECILQKVTLWTNKWDELGTSSGSSFFETKYFDDCKKIEFTKIGFIDLLIDKLEAKKNDIKNNQYITINHNPGIKSWSNFIENIKSEWDLIRLNLIDKEVKNAISSLWWD